jgi:hypothetical protein
MPLLGFPGSSAVPLRIIVEVLTVAPEMGLNTVTVGGVTSTSGISTFKVTG